MADAPPSPPRAITPRARRRSWNERPVRLWIILTTIVCASTLYFAIRDISDARHERKLIFNGIKVPATIELIDNNEIKSRNYTRAENHNLRVRFATPQGRTLKRDVVLPYSNNSMQLIRVGDTVELRMDPDDPESVTLQTQPRSWTAALSVVILLAPFSVLLMLVTLWQRRRVLRIWETGEAAEAVVVDSHRSGIAPLSRIVRFTIEGRDDRRVFSTLYPNDAGEIEPGELFWVVMPRNSPSSAVVAELYD